MNINLIRIIVLLFSLCGLGDTVLADGIDEPIPSFYQESGISRTRDYSEQHPAERIDPFTGKLQWHFVDLFIPGNGGMDLKVQRSYTSLGEQWPEPSPAGMGWTMHFGRVIRRANIAICNTTNSAATQNPVLELPDGSRRVLYVALDGASFVTTDFWMAQCDLSGNGGLKIFSPDGTRYSMTTQGVSFGSATNTQNVYYTTQITDRNGNWMNFTYDLVATGGAAVTGITTSDGRNVTFAYTSGALSSVSDGARTWNYVQAVAPGTSVMQLMEVQRPDGNSWKYAYNDGSGAAGSLSLRRVTYPAGGTIDYTYGFVQFATNASIPRSTVVMQKTASPGGTWTWAYTPATQPLLPDANGNITFTIPPATPETLDQTAVTGPDETRTYYHMGYNSASSGYTYVIGTLLGSSSPVQNESFYFTPMQISSQTNVRPGGTLVFDSVTSATLITAHYVGRAAETYSTIFSNFDGFANPRTIVETGTDTRTASVSYFTDPSKWILRVKKDESIQQGGETYAITRTFDPVGNMLSETRAGVTTNFTYTSEGEVASRTDARNNATSYSNYFRGIARSESQPEGVTISRTVGNAGNVTAQTDGELATTSFAYDGLNRVTGITHSVGNPVAVAWTSNTRKVTRGPLTELTTYDGFGRAISVQHTDTGSAQTITQSFQVDSLGRRVFASYPNAAIGTGFTYDMLNRPKLVLHEYTPGGSKFTSYRSYAHSGYSTELLNERGYHYLNRYRAYGDPEKRELVGITDPVTNYENTLIARNVAGQMTSVTRDSVARTYAYDNRFLLASVTEPETGITTLTRDEVGNVLTRQVGSSPATGYTYDGRNRVTAVNYPAGTPSVVNTYYKDDKLKSVDNGIARHDYQYDGNKNLVNETMNMGTRTFAVGYAYDGNDALSTLTYGSGRTVNYSPDGFGRPSQVGSYVTSVAYHPNGLTSNVTYGNGVQTTVALTARQWPASMQVTKGADLFNSSYQYDPAGNVTSINDAVDSSYARSLTYDGLDRLTGVNGPWGAGYVGYDLRGNITSQNIGSLSLTYAYDQASQRLASVSGSKAYTVGYDAYGNVTSNGTTTFNYDAAPNMRCAKCGQPDQILFDYDGAGQRVHIQKSGSETFLVYGKGGQLLWEETPGVSLKEYIYFHGKPVATREQPLP